MWAETHAAAPIFMHPCKTTQSYVIKRGRKKTTHYQRSLSDDPGSKNVCRMGPENGPVSEKKRA